MQAATDSPRWIVSIDPPPGLGTAPKTKPVYYWKLNDVHSVPAFDPPRFYLMKSLNSDLWFIPQDYVDLYVRGIPVGRRFPEVGLNMCDAYGLDGKPMEKIVKFKAELSAMITNAPQDVDKAKCELLENLVSYEAHRYGFQWYFTFDTFDHPINQRYVKLSDKDLRLMSTSGGIEQPEEVYILEKLVDHFASRNDNGHRFGIRTEDGTPKMFHMKDSVSVTKEEWAARKRRAISSLDGEGGWNRMINPVLDLYLVPVSDGWMDELYGIVEELKKQATSTLPKCLQTATVYMSETTLQASQVGTDGALAFTKVRILIMYQN